MMFLLLRSLWMQDGTAVHWPVLGVQKAVSSPTMLNPSLHVNLNSLAPTVSDVLPFTGKVGKPQ